MPRIAPEGAGPRRLPAINSKEPEERLSDVEAAVLDMGEPVAIKQTTTNLSVTNPLMRGSLR
jgi:hypothetical protein